MHGLVARNMVVLGAVAAAGLLILQLVTDGISGYRVSDVVSILLIAVPVAVSASRRSGRSGTGTAPPGRVEDGRGSGADATHPDAVDGDDRRSDRALAEPARIVERMIVRWIALTVAAGAWFAAVVLVLLQAWTPAVSSLIVMVLAAAGMPSDRSTAPVARPIDRR